MTAMLKFLTATLAILLAVETLMILLYRHPTNRFRPVGGYSGLVAFDTTSGQLCKTLVTKSAAEIARNAEPNEADSTATEEFIANLPVCKNMR